PAVTVSTPRSAAAAGRRCSTRTTLRHDCAVALKGSPNCWSRLAARPPVPIPLTVRTCHQSEDIVITRGRLSSRGATNALLAMIGALLALQLVSAHTEALLPRRLVAESVRRAGSSSDGPQPVYLVSGPAA